MITYNLKRKAKKIIRPAQEELEEMRKSAGDQIAAPVTDEEREREEEVKRKKEEVGKLKKHISEAGRIEDEIERARRLKEEREKIAEEIRNPKREDAGGEESKVTNPGDVILPPSRPPRGVPPGARKEQRKVEARLGKN